MQKITPAHGPKIACHHAPLFFRDHHQAAIHASNVDDLAVETTKTADIAVWLAPRCIRNETINQPKDYKATDKPSKDKCGAIGSLKERRPPHRNGDHNPEKTECDKEFHAGIVAPRSEV